MEQQKSNLKKKLKLILWPSIYFVLTIGICISVYYSVSNSYYTSFYVDGDSMNPTFLGSPNKCDYGIADPSEQAKQNIKRYQIVLTYFPKDQNSLKIKRVLFKPGEIFSVNKGDLYLYDGPNDFVGKKLEIPFERKIEPNCEYYYFSRTTLKENQYWLAGDHWGGSLDSFSYSVGAIDYSLINGVVVETQGYCKVDVATNTCYDKQPYEARHFWGVDY